MRSGQRAPSIEVSLPGRVRVCEPGPVFGRIARKPPGNRPDTAACPTTQKQGVGHEPRDTSIAVVERMYPQEAMVRSISEIP